MKLKRMRKKSFLAIPFSDFFFLNLFLLYLKLIHRLNACSSVCSLNSKKSYVFDLKE